MEIFKEIIVYILYFITIYFAVFWLLFFIDIFERIKKERNRTYASKKFYPVTLAVPAYNEEKTIKNTIISINNLDYPKDMIEIMVINDGSKDNTEKVVKDTVKFYKIDNLKLINIKNMGKASALNIALRKAKGKYFACLDADSFVDKDALKESVGFIQKDPDLAIITPIMQVNKPKNLIQLFQKIEYITAMLLVKLMGYIDSNYIAPGPFSLYKTDIIKRLGGFDENNLTEDQEIAYRVQSKHLKIRQCPTAKVYTNSPGTIKALYYQRNRWFKGTLQNLFKYKSIILNKKYGDFGIFQMPINIFAFILAFFAVFFFIFNLVKPLYKSIKHFYLVGFDYKYILTNISFDFSLLDVNITNYYIILVLLIVAGSMLYVSHKVEKKKVNYGILVLIPYFFIYYILLSFFAVIVLIESLFGVKQKW